MQSIKQLKSRTKCYEIYIFQKQAKRNNINGADHFASCLNYITLVKIQDYIRVRVSKTTFNISSVISWRSVLLVKKKNGVSSEKKHQPDKLYHIKLYTSPWVEIKVLIGTDWTYINLFSVTFSLVILLKLKVNQENS